LVSTDNAGVTDIGHGFALCQIRVISGHYRQKF